MHNIYYIPLKLPVVLHAVLSDAELEMAPGQVLARLSPPEYQSFRSGSDLDENLEQIKINTTYNRQTLHSNFANSFPTYPVGSGTPDQKL